MKFTIWNYRNIPYNRPLCIELREGITFILGPNNVGKSNILKFFYDFRTILSAFKRDQIKGMFSVSLESGFDYNKNRSSESRQIKVFIEGDGGEKAEFIIEPVPGDQVNTRNVNVKVNFEQGNDDMSVPKDFISEVLMLKGSLFLGPNRALGNKTFGKSMDLDTGNAFLKNWGAWADGEDISMIQKIGRLKFDLKEMFEFEDFNIRANDTKGELFVTIDGEDFLLSELGTGIAEFIVALSRATVEQCSYIFIDEPEASLHPKMQQAFVRALASRAKIGLFAVSHAVGLARSVGDHIYSLTKDASKRPVLRPFGEHYNPTLAQTASEMGYSQFVEVGGSNILLVEGRTDVKAYREIFRKYGIDNWFIVLPFGGSQFMAVDQSKIIEELMEVKRLNARSVTVIFDSERTSEGAALKPTFENFMEACRTLGFNCFATDRHSTENYISQVAIDKVLGGGHQALGPYEPFGASPKKWSKGINWRMFREMSRSDFAGTELDRFINETLLPLGRAE